VAAVALQCEVRSAEVLLLLRNGEKRMAYAVVNSLNDTAKLVQRAERQRVLGSLTVRRRDFIERQIAVIKPFASVAQARYQVRIAVGEKRRLLLSEFEAGGTREPFVGRNVAIPVTGSPARPSQAASVPESLFVKALQLRRRGGKRGRGPIVGLLETYIVPGVGIFQRQGERSVLLYAFKPSVRIPRRLSWVQTARVVVDAAFPLLLARRISETLAYQLRAQGSVT
jgi:hypothetical protein